MFSTTIHQLPYVRCYEEADRRFNQTALPRSKYWRDTMRPLKDTRSVHYRLERGVTSDGRKYYDAVLYSTAMARYYEPVPDGTKVICYTYHDSTSSKQFMYHVLGNSPILTRKTTDGREVCVPLAGNEGWHMDGRRFNAVLHYDAQGLLITGDSHHPRHYLPVELDSDKQQRLEFTKAIDNLLLLAAMRLPEYHAEAGFISHAAGPFRTATDHQAEYNMRRAMHDPNSPEFIEAFFDIGQMTYAVLLSKRHYAANGDMPGWGKSLPVSELKGAPITAGDLTKALKRKVLDVCKLNKKGGLRALPLFMDSSEFPKTTATGYILGRVVV